MFDGFISHHSANPDKDCSVEETITLIMEFMKSKVKVNLLFLFSHISSVGTSMPAQITCNCGQSLIRLLLMSC
jgi:hypothetical protein